VLDIIETWYVESEVGIALTAPQTKVLKEKRVTDKTTLYILYQEIDEVGFEKITGVTSAKEVTLYELKQTPRTWNTRINNYFKENSFIQFPFEHIIYVKAKKDELLIVALYVHDLIFMENSQRLIDEFKKMMKLEFKMTDLEMMMYFLNLEIK
jgi:Reverse transcriptase (RNA-dependent DNA polymerase)